MSPKNGDHAKGGERRRRSESRSSSREQSHRKRRERSPSRDRRSRSRSPPPTGGSKRLHIGNIDESIRRRDIEDTFAKYGRVDDIWLASYPPYYAFVVFERAEDASDALSDMRSGFIKDCRVRTTIALPRQNLRRAPLPTRRSYRRTPSPSMSPPPVRKRKNSRSRSASPRRERVSKEKEKKDKDKKEKDCKKKREKKSKKHHRSGSESS